MKVPRATYRLQFHPGFTFQDAACLTDYLAALGISHLYASPYLQAVSGSPHGYDVVDQGRVNEELGGAGGHQLLCTALKERGLGQILDVVPNHMAITGPENTWWWDVLEDGQSSPYAAYFDVDWHPPEERLGNKILLPVLGDHYGRVLESGEILLCHEKGRFSIHYHEQSFPAAPGSLVLILDRAAGISGSEQLGFIVDSLRHLPLPRAHEFEITRRRHRNWKVIQDLLCRVLTEAPETYTAVDKAVEEVNASPDLLDTFLSEQNYRLAFWRAAVRDLGYRRFFDINTLIGIRIEDKNVFADTHRLVLQWVQDGVLDGIRIDHPDGLRDPEQYFERLREAAPGAWIVVEKILHPGEQLSATWPVEGTTGYDFLNLLGGLFIDPAGEAPITDFYGEFTADSTDYRVIAREKKHLVLHELLAGDVNRLTELMIHVCERHAATETILGGRSTSLSEN
jgi:(1->4)-alpha-D-glucan 1-alpha-D-glucosylmutase